MPRLVHHPFGPAFRVPHSEERPKRFTHAQLMKVSKTNTPTTISKQLKKRGWSFVGPTTAYAFMQAMGIVNDHLEGCAHREKVEKKRKRFKRPS